MAFFSIFDSKSAKKSSKKKATKKSGSGTKRKASSGNPKIGMISKRAKKLYDNGEARTWASAMRKAAKM